MPFRNATTLQRWLDEFLAVEHRADGSIRVMEQDGAGGADTGLVSVRLANASTVTYIHPEGAGSTTWLVTMEPRETPCRARVATPSPNSPMSSTPSPSCARSWSGSRPSTWGTTPRSATPRGLSEP